MPVALHHLRPLDQHFARLTTRCFLTVVIYGLDPGIDYRLTDKTFLVRGLRGRGDHHRRGFGQAVTFTHHTAGALLPAAGDLGVQRRTAGVDPLQPAEVDTVEVRVIHQRYKQRVDTGQQGERMAFQVGDHAIEITRIGDQNGMEPGEHRGDAVRGEGEDMVQRQRRDSHLTAISHVAFLQNADCLQHVTENIAVGQHCALGDTGSTAGVLQQRQVVQFAIDSHRGQLVTQTQRLHKAHFIGGTRVVLRVAEVIHTGDDQRFDLGLVLDLAHQRDQLVEYHHRTGAGVGELVAGFVGGVLGVGVDDHQAGAQRAEDSNGVLQQVGQLNGQAVTRLQAGMLTQVASKGIGPATKLVKGQSVGTAGERRLVAITTAGLVKNIEDRGVTQLCQLCADGVMLRSRHLSLLFLNYCFALRNEIPKRCYSIRGRLCNDRDSRHCPR